MIETRVSDLRKYQKRMQNLTFSLVPLKDKAGVWRLRIGKKYILMDCPSKEMGENLKMEIQALFKRNYEKVSQIIEHVERHAEQITMELFPEESDDGTEGSGDKP